MHLIKKNKNYFLDYYLNGKRRRENVGPNLRLAEAILAKRKIQVIEKRFLDIKKPIHCSFVELAEEYLEYSKVNKKSYKKADIPNIRKFLAYFKGKNLEEINSLDVEKYKALSRTKHNHSPATVNRELAVLKHMFNKAIAWGKADHNPVRGVKFFAENNERTRFLTPKEYQELLLHSNEPLKTIIEFAVNTGLRCGEITNLKHADILWDRNVILITETKNNTPREIPMNARVREIISRLPRHFKSPYIFYGIRGEQMGKNWISRAFAKAVASAGITDIRFHDTRHTFASWLAMNGENLKTIQELLGHKSFKMTLRYSHLSPEHKQKAVEKLVPYQEEGKLPRKAVEGK